MVPALSITSGADFATLLQQVREHCRMCTVTPGKRHRCICLWSLYNWNSHGYGRESVLLSGEQYFVFSYTAGHAVQAKEPTTGTWN